MLVRRVVLNSACNCLGRRSLASEGRRLADRLLFFGKYKYMHFLAALEILSNIRHIKGISMLYFSTCIVFCCFSLCCLYCCQNWLSGLLSRLVVSIVVISSPSASSVSIFGIFFLNTVFPDSVGCWPKNNKTVTIIYYS